MARVAQADPAGARDSGRDLEPASEFRRDRAVETYPQMIVKLTEHLDIPLRERNNLLLAGGVMHRSTRSTD